MFQELMPLLSQRVLIVTLSRATDETVRVNVNPKPLKSFPSLRSHVIFLSPLEWLQSKDGE